MVGYDSTGPGLQLVRGRFWSFLLRKLSREFKRRGMSIMNFKWPYFRRPTAGGYGHMVGHTGTPICIAHTDVTLT